MNNNKINIYSEIGDLKKVLLHRPGEEIENLTPEYLERLLFDDIPFLKVARDEHDNFAKILRDNGVETIYLEDLMAQSIRNKDIKLKFLQEIMAECKIQDKDICNELEKYLLSMPNKKMIEKIMAGIRKKDIGIKEQGYEYPFFIDPMPNLYFTRDPFSCLGKGISLNSMKRKIRKRETIFGEYIFKYNPNFKNELIPIWYRKDNNYSIEGGDLLVLSKNVVAIGYSERTDKEAILSISKNLLKSKEPFQVIILVDIPKCRKFMHLDTVFTMVDYDKFTIHKEIENSLRLSAITYDPKNNLIMVKEENNSLQKVLSKYLSIDVTLIHCGGEDKITSEREQWNDGANALAISPGTVVTYERNYITNEILNKFNINVIDIPSSELSRGRGGPRCMSMPIYREDFRG